MNIDKKRKIEDSENPKDEKRSFLEYHENGTLKSINHMMNEIKHGQCISFDDSGQIKYIHNYENGKKCGLQKSYRNDRLIALANYKNDFRHGPRETYNDNGSKEFDENYENGKKNGVCIYYKDENRVSRTYKDDILDGSCETYDKNNKLLNRCFYKNGLKNGPYEINHLKQTEVGFYINDKRNGKCIITKNNIKIEKYYKDDKEIKLILPEQINFIKEKLIKTIEENEICVICYETIYNVDSQDLHVLMCGHNFHKGCLHEVKKCPLCRK